MDSTTFDRDLIHAIFKLVWNRRALEREKNKGTENLEGESGAETSKRSRPTSANANALKLSCELLRVFVIEAVQRAYTIAKMEGAGKIEATLVEMILPQLLLDF